MKQLLSKAQSHWCLERVVADLSGFHRLLIQSQFSCRLICLYMDESGEEVSMCSDCETVYLLFVNDICIMLI